MKNGRPQCKDIPTTLILNYLAVNNSRERWVTVREIHELVCGLPALTEVSRDESWNLTYRKMENIEARKLAWGCTTCSCSGWYLFRKGWREIGLEPPEKGFWDSFDPDLIESDSPKGASE